jgi:hypothetical protein
MGIPHSVFTGRVVQPGVDPEWTDEDQDKALAWNRVQSSLCPGCRTRRDLWREHDHTDPPYMGQIDQCPGCQMLEQERRNIPEGTEGYTSAYLVEKHQAEDPEEV